MWCCGGTVSHVKASSPGHEASYLTHACTAGVKQCLCVCVCVCVCVVKEILKNASSRIAKAFADIIVNKKTISIIRLGCFCTWYKSRHFFTPLFQLLPIIGFMAPPLSKSHMVVMVSNKNSYSHTRKYKRNRSGNVRRGARGKYSMNTL